MDTPVALVQAYLHINGYFTVTEYPVVEAMRRGGFRAATDLDILAVRFPGAQRRVAREPVGGSAEEEHSVPDPELGLLRDHVDMLIGEVKEGRAELNRGARDPDVLEAVLCRFGCCPADEAPPVVEHLLRRGHAQTACGHQVRLVAFGSEPPEHGGGRYAVITLGHVVRFIRGYLRRHWEVLHNAQFKDQALWFLMTLEKAARETE